MPRTTSRAKRTALAITEEMTLQNIPVHRIAHQSDGLTNSVKITLLDANPAVQARANRICAKYQILHEDPERPGRLIDNRRDDLPQATTVVLKNNLSDRLCATIARYINDHTPHRADIWRVWHLFEGKSAEFWLHHQRHGRRRQTA